MRYVYALCLLFSLILFSIEAFCQEVGRDGEDPSAISYIYSKEDPGWIELHERLMRTNDGGSPERIELEINGGTYSQFYRVTYLIDARGGLKVTKVIYNEDVPGHELKIYDTETNDKNRFIIGIKVPKGFYSLCFRARETSTGRWLKFSTVSEPTQYANVTPSIKLMPHPMADGRFRLEGDYAGIWVESGTTDWFIGRSSTTGSSLRFHNGGIDRMTLTTAGNLGIGTANPGNYRLAVNGMIGAKEVEVQNTNWPDFVFKRDYRLPSLREVEQHIQEKGHLPAMPSEAEVKEKGFALGEMDAKLLQKIEELTLYIINQEKRLQQLEEKNQILEEKLLK